LLIDLRFWPTPGFDGRISRQTIEESMFAATALAQDVFRLIIESKNADEADRARQAVLATRRLLYQHNLGRLAKRTSANKEAIQ